jgi:hypothetical protein
MSEQHENYEVGFGKPPKHTRWQKGQSGNPRGRPKKTKSFAEILGGYLFEKKIPVTEGDRHQVVSVAEAIVLRLIKDALAGKHQARAMILALQQAQEERVQDTGEEQILSEDDEAAARAAIGRIAADIVAEQSAAQDTLN